MLVYSHFYSISRTSFSDLKLIKIRNRNLACPSKWKLSLNLPKNSLIVIWKKLLTCGIQKVHGLLCKHSFTLISHYICILSLLMHFVKHWSTSIMNFNNIIPKEAKGSPPPPLNETPLGYNFVLLVTLMSVQVEVRRKIFMVISKILLQLLMFQTYMLP